jgi:hypothetical protein
MDKNIRKGIEQSEYFIAIIEEHYYDDPDCIEQFLYAKNLGKPMILYIKKGINKIITELFKNCDIKHTFMFDDIKDIEKSKGKLFNVLNLNG